MNRIHRSKGASLRTLCRAAVQHGLPVLLGAGALLGGAAHVQAQSIETCIVGATVHPVATPAFEGTLCFANGRITGLGAAHTPPAGAREIDGTGLLVTPGFVEIGSSLGVEEISMVEESVDSDAGTDDPIRAAFRAVDGFNASSVLIPVARSGGITSAIVTPRGGMISGVASWVDLTTQQPDARIIERDALMVMGYNSGTAGIVGGARGELMLRYRTLFEDVRAWAADPSSYDGNQMRALAAERIDLQALLPFVNGELRAFVQADGRSDIESALRLAEEVGFPLAIYGGSEAWAVAPALAAADVPVVMQAFENLPSSFDHMGARADAPALLHAAGVRVALAVWDTHNARTLRQHAGNAVRDGLPWEAALAALTQVPAEIAGVDDAYGSLQVGYVANLAVWSGDPFEFTTSLRHLFVQGLEESLWDRQDALLERHRQPWRMPETVAP